MQKTALQVSGAVFTLVALAHLTRLILKFQIMAGHHYIPLRVNAVGLLVALGLACWMFKASKA